MYLLFLSEILKETFRLEEETDNGHGKLDLKLKRLALIIFMRVWIFNPSFLFRPRVKNIVCILCAKRFFLPLNFFSYERPFPLYSFTGFDGEEWNHTFYDEHDVIHSHCAWRSAVITAALEGKTGPSDNARVLTLGEDMDEEFRQANLVVAGLGENEDNSHARAVLGSDTELLNAVSDTDGLYGVADAEAEK